MNKRSLSQLYRSDRSGGVKPLDADTLLALAHGERRADGDRAVAELAGSPLNGALLRFARDLESASAALGAELATALPDNGVEHHRSVTRRSAHGVRRWRVAAALAASLIVGVFAWNTQRVRQPGVAATTVQSVQRNDRIFAVSDEKSFANRGDEIFRAEFLSDEIFNSKMHDG